MTPYLNNQRDQLVDILRGWAFLGVTLINYGGIYYWSRKLDTPKDSLTVMLGYIMKYVFSAKSWTLLSILFGYGFSVFMSKKENDNFKPAFFFQKRMLWLFVFAIVNTLFFFGDILRDYAMLGILLSAFHRFKVRNLSAIAIALFISIPFVSGVVQSWHIDFLSEREKLVPLFYSYRWLDVFQFNVVFSYYAEIFNPNYSITVHLVMFLCMLFGMVIHRSQFLKKIESNRMIIKRIFWSALPSSIALNTILLLAPNAKGFEYFRLGDWATLSTMITLASGISWLYFVGKMKVLFSSLSKIGRMTFTHYLTSCFLIAILFSGAGLRIFNTMPFWFYPLVGLLIYVAQLFFSLMWLAKYNYGPAEWLWRRLTYGVAIPNRKETQLPENQIRV